MAELIKSVAAGSDDCYTFSSTMRLDRDYVFIDHNNYWIHGYFRFLNVTVPKNATILSAKLTFVETSSPGVSSNLTIAAIDEDDTATFSTAADADGRPVTTAQTNWSPGAMETGTEYDTPDLTDEVQEIVNREGWASGNAMAFKIWNTAKTQERRPASYEDGVLAPAKLTISYASGKAIPTGFIM
jgi:hypothetical protein